MHSLEASNRSYNPDPTPEDAERWRKAEALRERSGRIGVKEHPLVWRHATGRKSLVLGMTTDHVAGVPESEDRRCWRGSPRTRRDRRTSTATSGASATCCCGTTAA